jgi:hypothetical protein
VDLSPNDAKALLEHANAASSSVRRVTATRRANVLVVWALCIAVVLPLFDFIGASFGFVLWAATIVGAYFLASWQRWYLSGSDGKGRAPFDLNFALVPTTFMTGIPVSKISTAYLGLYILAMVPGAVASIAYHFRFPSTMGGMLLALFLVSISVRIRRAR